MWFVHSFIHVYACIYVSVCVFVCVCVCWGGGGGYRSVYFWLCVWLSHCACVPSVISIKITILYWHCTYGDILSGNSKCFYKIVVTTLQPEKCSRSKNESIVRFKLNVYVGICVCAAWTRMLEKNMMICRT